MGYQRPLGAQSEGSKAPSGLKVKKKVGAKMAGAKMAGAKTAERKRLERYRWRDFNFQPLEKIARHIFLH